MFEIWYTETKKIFSANLTAKHFFLGIPIWAWLFSSLFSASKAKIQKCPLTALINRLWLKIERIFLADKCSYDTSQSPPPPRPTVEGGEVLLLVLLLVPLSFFLILTDYP